MANGRLALAQLIRRLIKRADKIWGSLWCHVGGRYGWFHGSYSVFFQLGYKPARPGAVLRGYGNAFLPVTADPQSWRYAYSELSRLVPDFGSGEVAASELRAPIVADETVAARVAARQTPAQRKMQDQFDQVLAAGKNLAAHTQVADRHPGESRCAKRMDQCQVRLTEEREAYRAMAQEQVSAERTLGTVTEAMAYLDHCLAGGTARDFFAKANLWLKFS